MNESKSTNKAIIGLVVIVLLVVAATTAIVSGSSAKSSPSVASNTTSSDTKKYKDGSYDATGKYTSPGGDESIDVKVTLAGNVITDATVTSINPDAEAGLYQNKFISGYKTQVVGKKIGDVSLSRVAGSSLTSIGFNSALDTIKTQAAA